MYSACKQPIVIIGGFLSSQRFYKELSDILSDLSGQPVVVCNIGFFSWLRVFSAKGWLKILLKLKSTVEEAAKNSPTGKVVLIAHSSGGVMARLFLTPDQFKGNRFNGLNYVSDLVTLGSPHYSERSTPMRKYVQKKYPDSYFQPDVKYFSVAGAAVKGQKRHSLVSLISYYCYKYLCGDGNVIGDGLVPVESALLHGSKRIILEEVGHPFIGARKWYGKPEIVKKWWHEFISVKADRA